MTDRIVSSLTRLGADAWIVNYAQTESAELFMIKKREDMRRAKLIEEALVTVYRDFDAPEGKMRGSATVMIYPAMTDEEIYQKLASALENAGYINNPFYALPSPTVDDRAAAFCPGSALEAALRMRDALYKNDTSSVCFINSSEIFAVRSRKLVLTSEGTRAGYYSEEIKGEFVVQCVDGADVEMYFDFDYSFDDTLSLSALAAEALKTVSDRARAKEAPAAGEYDVILTDSRVITLLGAYTERTNASLVYPGYSAFKIGTDIYEGEVKGERLNIDVFSREPFSDDGVPMPERELIKDGIVKTIHGPTRYCRYLEIEPIGSYYRIKAANGSVSLDDMKSRRVLMPVAFSDFQCDSMTGTFGGEIRLAYLFENGNVKLLTGGSINGSLTKKQSEFVFSKERFENSVYSGPKAVLIPGVSVAGA